MTCPKNLYNNLTRSCCSACPIREGQAIPDNYYSVLTAVNNKDSPGYGLGRSYINNAVWRGQIWRDKYRKQVNQEHTKIGKRVGIPECALVAYLEYQRQKHENQEQLKRVSDEKRAQKKRKSNKNI